MSNGALSGSSGSRTSFVAGYETRRIIIGQGLDYRDADVTNRHNSERTQFDFLAGRLGGDFKKTSDLQAEYRSDAQKVLFLLDIVRTKSAFKTALETDGVHVVYCGHSRIGRGACFDSAAAVTGTGGEHGDQWDQGTSAANGLFRLGYPFVPIPISDIKEHKYHFAPLPVEGGLPARDRHHPHRFHPDASGELLRVRLHSEDVMDLVRPENRSPSNRYFGVSIRGEKHLLLHAGWSGTASDPFDLGGTTMRCRVFCHFGCSSQTHYWRIVRRDEYKAWQRDSPPTDRFAYFNTAPAIVWNWWLYAVLSYDKDNRDQSWWRSLEWAKGRANQSLRAERERARIY